MSNKKEQYGKSENKTQILIVDDHSIVRKGLIQLINEEPDLVVCAEAESAERALEVIKKQQIDLAIVDLSLGAMSGTELTGKIRRLYPDIPVVVLSMYEGTVYAKRALQEGARGYVAKHDATEEIITAIREVLDGKIYVSKKMATKVTLAGPSDMNNSLDLNKTISPNLH